MKVDRATLAVKMKHGAIIGALVGAALFGVAYTSWGTLIHVIFIPLAAIIGYFTPKLLVNPDDLE